MRWRIRSRGMRTRATSSRRRSCRPIMPWELESVGTTVEEELAGETLDQHLAEERPERPGIDTALSVVDEGPSDDEEELVGDAVVERDEFASPEEAALSVRDSAPGATDHDDPHPADGD